MIEDLILQLDIYRHIMAVLIGMPRLFVIVMLAPFLGTAVVTGQLRLVMVGSIYLILHNYILSYIPNINDFSSILTLESTFLIFKEIALGFLIGYLGALLFWSVQSAGFFIDNQRGASQAEGADISSGDTVSPIGGLFFQSVTYLFFATGGFLTYLSIIYTSYQIFPPTEFMAMNINLPLALFFASKMSWLFLTMLLLASPIAVACLLTDISLGLVNRFASQLNVYVLAMPIKSGLTAFLLCFYYLVFLAFMPKLYKEINGFVLMLEEMLVR